MKLESFKLSLGKKVVCNINYNLRFLSNLNVGWVRSGSITNETIFSASGVFPLLWEAGWVGRSRGGGGAVAAGGGGGMGAARRGPEAGWGERSAGSGLRLPASHHDLPQRAHGQASQRPRLSGALPLMLPRLPPTVWQCGPAQAHSSPPYPILLRQGYSVQLTLVFYYTIPLKA